MSKKLKKKLKRIIIALSAFLLLMLADKVILPLAFDKNLATVIDGKYGWTLAFGLSSDCSSAYMYTSGMTYFEKLR